MCKQEVKEIYKRPHRVSCRYWGLNDPFCCVYRSCTAETCNAFQSAVQPQNFLFQWESRTPSNTSFLWSTRVSPQTASRSVQSFRRAHECDQQRQTTPYFVCSNRPHLLQLLLRCGLKTECVIFNC